MDEERNAPARGGIQRWGRLLIAVLLVFYGVVAYTAAERHSPGYDEPLHAAGNHIQRFYGDSRATPEDPPVFSWLSTILHRRDDLHVDLQNPLFLNSLTGKRDLTFLGITMYRTPGNDPERYLARSRIVFTLLAMGFGAVTAAWAWKLGGPVTGIAAATLFALDPNLIAHGPFVCSDVPLALAFLLTVIAAWALGRRATPLRAIGVGLALAAALNIKTSGLLLVPILPMLLAYRAWFGEPRWTVAGFTRRASTAKSTAARVSTGLTALVVIGVVAWATTWTLYGFRFRPAPDPSARLGLERPIMNAKTSYAVLTVARGETVVPPDQQPTPIVARLFVELYRWRVMPEAWLHGMLATWATTIVRPSYLLGERAMDGWWYYFPFSLLVKLPLATLVAAVLAVVAWALRHALIDDNRSVAVEGAVDAEADVETDAQASTGPASSENAPVARPGDLARWDVACLLVPIAVYGWISIRASTNLGVRHLMPLMPFLYIVIAIALGRAVYIFSKPRWVVGTLAALGIVLAVETLSAYPGYISYFNVAAGGSRGGLELLGDSSLDWGQGLKHLAAWQQKHPDEKLYLSYFGSAYPAYYGIRSSSMGIGYPFTPNEQTQLEPGVLAISATYLQGLGTLWPPNAPRVKFPKQEPFEVLDGSIYLYRWPSPTGETGGRYR